MLLLRQLLRHEGKQAWRGHANSWKGKGVGCSSLRAAISLPAKVTKADADMITYSGRTMWSSIWMPIMAGSTTMPPSSLLKKAW